MKSFASVLSFAPTRLPMARERVVELHPSTRSRLARLGPNALKALRDRVEAAAGAQDPRTALASLADELAYREVLAVVQAIGSWDGLAHAISAIARRRPMAAQVPVLWMSWQSFPCSAPTIELLAEMASRFGMERATDQRYADDAAEWLREERPIDAIVQWAEDQEATWEDLPELPESPFKAGAPLLERVFLRTLQIGSLRQLLEMPQQTVLDGWSRMSGKGRMDACANLLNRLGPAIWHEWRIVLEEVRESYGIPGAPEAVSRFWKRVLEERRQAFRLHFIARELEIAFGGDTTPDRRNFWMSQKEEIVSARHGTAGETSWSLIDFPGFSVIEFFEVGNAAYLYPADHALIRKIKLGRRIAHPNELKERLEFVGPGGGPDHLSSLLVFPRDNRIIHSGRWQPRAATFLREWHARFPGP